MELKNPTTIIKWCVAVLLTAKGLLHFTTDQPYYHLGETYNWITPFLGIVLLIFGITALLPTKFLSKGAWIYAFVVPSKILMIQSFWSFIYADFVFEQLLEHSLQVFLPILLIYVFTANKLTANRLYNVLAVLVGLTFIGHAIFAIGLNYVPDHFIEMTTKSLSISENSAITFLFVVGCLDIICALLAFVPLFRRYVIWYLIVWGFLTSIARTYYVLGDGIDSDIFIVNLPNTIYRLPHGMIPVLMLMLVSRNNLALHRK